MAIGDRGKDLSHYISVLRRWKWGIAFLMLLATGTAVVLTSAQAPVYQASARVLLSSSQSTVTAGVFGQYIDPNSIQTEIQVLLGKPVLDIVTADLGYAPAISAGVVGSTAVIELTARSGSPQAAAEAANAYAGGYIKYRREQFLTSVSAAAREYSDQIQALQERISQIESRPRPTGAVATDSELESLRAQQSTFRTKLQEVGAAEKLAGNTAAVISPAAVPSASINASPVRNGALGAGAGLVMAVALALLLDHLDDSIKTKDDIQGATPNLPVLGEIPTVPNWRNQSEPRLVSMIDPNAAAAEAYRSLRTSIQFIGIDRSLRVLQLTSAVAGEGKTTTLANLAVALSQAGSRVIVVSCDLRRPRIHEFFGLSNEVGFTTLLIGSDTLRTALLPVPGNSRLKVLPSGPLPPNPSELLSSFRTAEVFTQLRSQSDIVLVDCPPLLPVTDAAVLSNRVDGTLLVASSGRTKIKELARASELLGQVDATVLGVILNGTAAGDVYTYPYRQSGPTLRAEGRGRRERRAGGGRKAGHEPQDEDRQAS